MANKEDFLERGNFEEEVKEPKIKEDDIVEEEKLEVLQDDKDKKQKGYLAYSNDHKLRVLNKFIELTKKKEKEPEDSQPKSETALLKEAIKTVNKNINFETARSWLKSLKKAPEYLIELERKVLKKEKGKHILNRETKLSYSLEEENQIVEWIQYHRQNEIPLTSIDVREFAKELLGQEYPGFKASYRWFQKFMLRNNLSLRVPNGKASQQLPKEWLKLANEFREEIKSKATECKIQPQFIINMDETPLFYEYLPKKVIEEKGKKDVKTWKAGLDKKRSTLVLAVTQTGLLLEPSLILPRKTRYELKLRNKLKMKVYGTVTANAWMDSETMILWLKEVLLPYVGDNQALLILDSYASHYSKEVRDFVKNTNISLAVIPGGLTPILQPLDYTINAMFKHWIKECSQKHQTKGAMLNVENNFIKGKDDQEGRENTVEVVENIIISKFDQERGVK